MALCSEMIDFIRLESIKKLDQIRRVRYVAIMQKQLYSIYMRILIKMINAAGIECRSTTYNPVHFVAFLEEELRKIRTILARDACDQRFLH